MRTTLIALLLALALTGCGFADDSPEEPTTPAVAGEADGAPADAATQEADGSEEEGAAASTNEVMDIVPDGPLATVQLANGSTLEILGLEKLGKYYLYLHGDLNGRSSTIISYTRFQDMARWDAIIFKDENNFIVTTKQGKEMIFMNARLFLGSDSNDTYAFYSFNDDYEKVLVEVQKSAVASIKFK
ncbi:MAG: hypothetical protein H0S80_14190 [Desulfovibrionaceae bacterium]|nr:hypothetical protein [Desulfovibrionaceae bacterium]